MHKFNFLTCKHSAAFRKLESASWDTCTSPLYINSKRADILAADVPSRITNKFWCNGAVSNKSARCLLHAANINLCALNVTPVTKELCQYSTALYIRLFIYLYFTIFFPGIVCISDNLCFQCNQKMTSY